MERDFLQELKAWKDSPRRKPMVLQGARQVGKSWLLHEFGRTCYDKVAYVNFDTLPELKADFARTKDPKRLVPLLEQTVGTPITPGDTLIILDEIQECNDALNSLKYFGEEAPQYHIVAAGSLLGVALNRDGASFPVGKVNIKHLYPLSFGEYLRAAQPQLHNVWQHLDPAQPVAQVIHSQLLDHYKIYLALGGMPEAVGTYIDSHDWTAVDEVLDNILASYSLDFSKHIGNKDIPRVFAVWNTLHDQLARDNRKFRYADIRHGARAREYEAAIEWLCLAGIVHRVNAVETVKLPVSAYKKSSHFKLYMSDVGLLRTKYRLKTPQAMAGNKLFTEFKGVMAENFVLQSLVRQFGGEQYYWTSGNTAEVEFVLPTASDIVPIEVKSGNSITAKSLSEYRKKYRPLLSVRFSMLNLHRNNDLLNLPLYLADRLNEFLP